MINRTYTVIGELQVIATDQASAQAATEAAIGAIRAALEALNNGVSFSAEEEQGQFVFSEP